MAVVGAQYGSEGKGVVAHYLSKEYDIAVRTGGPNAGHSFVHEGKLYKMQSLPCGWVNPNCWLIIGRGALIAVDVLLKEIEEVSKVTSLVGRLHIDAGAGIIDERHHQEEGGVNGDMHKRMGSTGEGVGAARRDRMMREPSKFRFARDIAELAPYIYDDTAEALYSGVSGGKSLLLEGTQGAGLSLIHGSWPHVTSNDTNAAQMAADAGIPPQWVDDTILVARTYPIRVAGPSGPLKGELSWAEMSDRVGKKVEEKTTVTKKIRRIGEWDEDLLRKAIQLNDPKNVALTFMDYLSPEDTGKTEFSSLSDKAMDFVHYVERAFSVRVGLIGTGWDEKKGWTCIDRRG